MIYWLLNILFDKIKHPFPYPISREEKEFILTHYPNAQLDDHSPQARRSPLHADPQPRG